MSDKLRFGEILVRAGVLDRARLDEVIAEAERSPFDLGELLSARGLVDEQVMQKTISKALNLPSVSLAQVEPDRRAVDLVPRELCVEHFLVPIEVERSRAGEHLHVAMANPSDIQAIKRVTRTARLRIRPLVAAGREIREAISRFYGGPEVPGPSSASQPSMPSMPSVSSSGSGAVSSPSMSAPPASGDPTAMFDFGVTDLSSYDDGEAPPMAPPGSVNITRSRPPKPLDDDLVDLLDTNARQSLVGTSDLDRSTPPRAQSEPDPGMGLIKKKPRRGRRDSPTSGELPPLPQRANKPLPPLPPGLRGGGGKSRTVSLTPLPKQPSVDRHPGPPGLVDDVSDAGLKDVLGRFNQELPGESGEAVISEHLEKFGEPAPVAHSQVFEALDRALEGTGSSSSRLLIALIRQLARRGLVDPTELLIDLARDDG